MALHCSLKIDLIELQYKTFERYNLTIVITLILTNLIYTKKKRSLD